MTDSLVAIADRLRHAVDGLAFAPPVTHVYNPLDYAWRPHRLYLERYGAAPKEVVLVGMNPGPWGMVQTGVPFGEVGLVREWLGIDGEVGRPCPEHPQRSVAGFACTRSEVSGRRLWGWAQQRFGTPGSFFRRFFVWNYCPLAFLEASGRNRTPDKLPAADRVPLEAACDQALRAVVDTLAPRWVLGLGRFAERRVRAALDGLDVATGQILHPSPASPLANDGWEERAEAQLRGLGIALS